MADTKQPCCFPECSKDSEFTIYGSSGHPDDYTESCESHIGILLGTPESVEVSNEYWTVYPVEEGAVD